MKILAKIDKDKYIAEVSVKTINALHGLESSYGRSIHVKRNGFEVTPDSENLLPNDELYNIDKFVGTAQFCINAYKNIKDSITTFKAQSTKMLNLLNNNGLQD